MQIFNYTDISHVVSINHISENIISNMLHFSIIYQ